MYNIEEQFANDKKITMMYLSEVYNMKNMQDANDKNNNDVFI